MSPKKGHIPIRTCIVCKRRRQRFKLQRMVFSGNVIKPDKDGRKDGRGGYCCLDGDCLLTLRTNRQQRKLNKRIVTAFRARDEHIGIQ